MCPVETTAQTTGGLSPPVIGEATSYFAEYLLYVAGNGLEALEMLRGKGGKPPEYPLERRIILLDLNMPKMNGIEFLHELRADPDLRPIPVIVLTTSGEERDKVDAYKLNVAGYILKPVTLGSFIETMATLNKYWMLSELP